MEQGPFRKTLQRGDGEAGEEVSTYRLSLVLWMTAWQDGRRGDGLLGCPHQVGKAHRMALLSTLGPHILGFDFLYLDLN